MRTAALSVVTLLGASSLAWADGEASAMIGIRTFADNTGIGQAWNDESAPSTQPTFGLRITELFADLWRDRDARAQFGVEAEGDVALASSSDGMPNGRDYVAPTFGYRGHAIVGLGNDDVRAHLLAGVGGETLRSRSPAITNTTDLRVYYGIGFAFPPGEKLMFRFDLLHGYMPGDGNTWGQVVDLKLSMSFRTHSKRRPARRDVDERKRSESVAVARAQAEPKYVPRYDDDKDLIWEANDACPNQAEDKDGYQDQDGCPEPDNDGDGLADVSDGCPLAREAWNGFEDGDGCPDTIPTTTASPTSPPAGAPTITSPSAAAPTAAGPAAAAPTATSATGASAATATR